MNTQIQQVPAQRVKEAIDLHESCIIIDVRTPEEYSRGNIEGSLNYPWETIDRLLPAKISDTDTTIYVYCLSGSRSMHAAASLMALGYTKVFDMQSGLLAWRALGYPLVG